MTVKYKILKAEGEYENYEVGSVTIRGEMDEPSEHSKALIEAGVLEPVVDEVPEVVTQEMLDANPQLAEYGVEVGSPITLATEAEAKILDARVAAETAAKASEANQENNIADVDQSVFGNIAAPGVEPRKRYRGHIVLAEEIRTVGEQSFKHVTLGDGSQQDLTDAEYDGAVKVSYPPQA